MGGYLTQWDVSIAVEVIAYQTVYSMTTNVFSLASRFANGYSVKATWSDQ